MRGHKGMKKKIDLTTTYNIEKIIIFIFIFIFIFTSVPLKLGRIKN